MPLSMRQAFMRSCSEMAGHFFVRWLVRLSIRPLGKFSPQSLQVWGYLQTKRLVDIL